MSDKSVYSSAKVVRLSWLCIGLLLVLVCVLFGHITIDRAAQASEQACSAMMNGGGFYDLFNSGIGRVVDKHGNPVQEGIRESAINRDCFGKPGWQPRYQFVVECGGCAPAATRRIQ